MKNIYVALLILNCITGRSQLNSSWPDSNATWVNAYYHVSSPYPSLQSVDYYCMGIADTVINAVQYSQISNCLNSYRGALRDANGKVYYVPKDSVREYLLYDFTAQEDDTIRNVYMEYGWGGFGLEELVVAQIDSILVNNSWRKRMHFYSGSSEWIEGVGNTQGFLWDIYPNISNFWINLECLSVNDSSIYPTSGYGPCDLLTVGQSPDVDVYVSVKDTNGNPVKGYNAHIGRGTSLSVQYPNIIVTDQRGVGHGVVSAAPTKSLFAYIFDCNGDSLVDFQPAIPKTANDSVLFEFVVECPGDTCGIVLRHELVDKDSNYYQLYYGEIGVGGFRLLTPTWTFSDSTFILDSEPVKQFGPGWNIYCIDYGCDTATCDSVYVMPDCNARFYSDTSGGVLRFWQNYRVSSSSYNFTWSFGDGTTSNSPFPTHTYVQPGSYNVCLTVSYLDDSTSCADTYCANVTLSAANQTVQVMDSASIGVEDFEFESFDIYPNPANKYLIIEGEGLRYIDRFQLYDMNGRLVKSWLNTRGERLKVDVESLTSGAYFLKPEGGSHTSGKLIIIE